MTTSRSLALLAILVLSAGGCDKNPVGPSEARLLAATGQQTPPSPVGNGCGDLPTAPESLRVDLYAPSFPSPTQVTNPLFPIRELDRVLLLGSVEGVPLRVETTLLARHQMIRVDGQRVEALVSQYVAWLDRRIEEVAIDWYVQDDQGAAWYLGEDVFNYENGRIADREGTWLAGRDGPAAMIMPADPQVGDVWRPENVCGLVFEEVMATATGVTVEGPRGPVTGALVVRELHMDGTFEDKTFAPGYGEFSTGSGSDLEAVALAIPTDALPGPVPGELEILSEGAQAIFDAAESEEWDDASAILSGMTAAWTAFQAGGVPPMLDAQMNGALATLAAAVQAAEAEATRQASIDVARASLDLQLRHRPRAEIDEDQLELWALQLAIDAEARDRAAVLGDMATIRWIRDRFAHPLGGKIDGDLSALLSAGAATDLATVSEIARRLRAALDSVTAR